MYKVLLHDERLSGNNPDLDDTSAFTVEEDTPIEVVLHWVHYCYEHYGKFQSSGKIDYLLIMCHGYVSGSNGNGGHGLELSRDGVYLFNINKWSEIQGMVQYIIVYACKTADIDPAVQPYQGDGRALCRQMAAVTGATVIASSDTQEYHKSINPLSWREIDFGDWEGSVYSFRPDGTVTDITD